MANYTVPYKAFLQGMLRSGSVIRIRGMVPINGKRFEVNLCCEGLEGNKALHCNLRLDEEAVVFNSFQGGAWGREERTPSFLFQRGKRFELNIRVTDNSYMATVGDTIFHSFRHRLPLNLVHVLEVVGDVLLESVSVL